MIARFVLLLPTRFLVPEGEQFPISEYVDEGYAVRVYPPGKSDQQYPPDRIGDIKLDTKPAFQADILRIYFHKDAFDRTQGVILDPPEAVLRRAINYFLVRLRYVARAPALRSIDFPMGTWRLEYLNDDESELPAAPPLVRMRGAIGLSFNWIAVNKAIWEDVHSVPPEFEPPPWEELLLDAQGDLPRIGPAIVLAATALEVFVSWVLDQLAAKGAISADLWTWINDRGNYLREPTVEEQFDVLLRLFAGHSLKEDNRLWESFVQLKNARNAFVHEGRAAINKVPVTLETARRLVTTAPEIVAKVREWLPADLQWPVFKHAVQVQATFKLSQ
jgi:hypothetical protein